MKLTKKQQLTLHNVLFHYLSSKDVDFDVSSDLKDIMSLLELDLLGDQEQDADDVDDFEDESDDDFDLESDEDFLKVTRDELVDLGKLRYGARGEKKQNLYFEVSAESLDLVTDGTVIEGVSKIIRTSDSVEVKHEDGLWEVFIVDKFPASWTNLLKLGETYVVEEN